MCDRISEVLELICSKIYNTGQYDKFLNNMGKLVFKKIHLDVGKRVMDVEGRRIKEEQSGSGSTVSRTT